MKKFRTYWNNDIIKYIFKAYEHAFEINNCCDNCSFYTDLHNEIVYVNDDHQHIMVKDNKETPIEQLYKPCNTCMLYY